MAGFDGEVGNVGGESGELNGGASGACAKGEEGKVACIYMSMNAKRGSRGRDGTN